MNILVTLDDNYIRPLFIMLESLFRHEKSKMDIYLFYSDVSEDNRKRLHTYIKKRGSRFIPIYVEDDVFQDAPVFRYFTKEMYYRLLCSRLLPETEERVLYLDPDILIRGALLPFYEMDFQGKQLIGMEDYAINHMLTEKKDAIAFKKEECYINSGVLLFNLTKMRKAFVLEDFINLLEARKDQISYPDQDLINLYFREDKLVGERIYNYNTGYGSIKGMLAWAFGLKREKEEPVIIHYMGKSKPWQVDYYGKYYFEYYHYLKKHLSFKGKILFFFKPCYVAVKLGKALVRKWGAFLVNGERGDKR
ncbi:MAG: glycosyltransferase family 8 protein [Lachnospiraceae bacterium]|nr:glycosyltransferase family 8 protein [Lachnospiraceae bacterium]